MKLNPHRSNHHQNKHQHHQDSNPNCHHHSMSNQKAAADFLNRFFIVSVLLAPLVIFSPWAIKYLGVNDFTFRPVLEFVIATAIFYFGLVFFEHAKHEIKSKRYGMMTLVALAVGAGYAFSVLATFIPTFNHRFYLEISTLIWVLLFGHYLEARSATAAGDALSEIAKLLPKTAHLVKDKTTNKLTDVSIDQLKPGDLLLVKTGEKVPADGRVVAGEASVNQSLITGESKPVVKKDKDVVVAGSVLVDGSIYLQVTRVGEHSTIGQIKNLVAQAQKTKPSTQVLADRSAKWLTFVALGVAIIAFAAWLVLGQTLAFALTIAITVLVIACPHALGLAIPAVTTIATRLATKHGLFIKDLSKLEVIKSASYVAFDKTGTLTTGKFDLDELAFMENLTELTNLPEWSQFSSATTLKQQLISMVVAVESHSNHPLARAITNSLKQKLKRKPNLKVSQFKNHPGKGVLALVGKRRVMIGTREWMIDQKVMLCAHLDPLTQTWQQQGKTTVYVAVDKKHLISLALSDQVRPESAKAIKLLHQLGVKVAMLTGDNQAVADSVAKQLQIDTVFAQASPKDKYQQIHALQKGGEVVLMVGDGINDAPALTQADVGIATGSGTDVAIESGEVVLTKNNPLDIARLIILSRKTYQKIIENLFWAMGYNLIAIPTAAGVLAPLGLFLNPGLGAFLMSLSSVVVVINAFGLKKINLALDDV